MVANRMQAFWRIRYLHICIYHECKHSSNGTSFSWSCSTASLEEHIMMWPLSTTFTTCALGWDMIVAEVWVYPMWKTYILIAVFNLDPLFMWEGVSWSWVNVTGCREIKVYHRSISALKQCIVASKKLCHCVCTPVRIHVRKHIRDTTW